MKATSHLLLDVPPPQSTRLRLTAYSKHTTTTLPPDTVCLSLRRLK